MSETSKVRVVSSIIPYEEIYDGDNFSRRLLHSRINEVLGGRRLKSLASLTDMSWVKNEDVVAESLTISVIGYQSSVYPLFKMFASDGLDLHNDNATNTNFIYIEIVKGLGSTTPNVGISLDGTNVIAELNGVGDFCVLPTYNLSLGQVLKFKKMLSTSDARLRWIAGRL